MKINILTTVWNRTPERFQYFKKTVESVEKYIDWGRYIPEWIVSCEYIGHHLKEEMEKFCEEHNIKLVYHRGKPGIGRNTNHGLSLCDSPVTLFIQDDCAAVEPLKIWQDIDWLLSEEGKGIGMLRLYAHFERDYQRGHMQLLNKDLSIYLVDPAASYYVNFHAHLRTKLWTDTVGKFSEEFRYKSKQHPDGIDGGVAENTMVKQARRISDKLKVAYKRGSLVSSKGTYKNYFAKQKMPVEHSVLREKWERGKAKKKKHIVDLSVPTSLNQVVENGICLPWFYPPSLDFIKTIIRPDWFVFEYGSGAGTYWWSLHVKEIIAVEHSALWFDSVRDLLNRKNVENAEVIFRKTQKGVDSDYVRSITENERQYDCIVIDGRQRLRCARYAVKKIKKGGYIILDNAERAHYKDIGILFAKRGFEFYGFKSPLTGYETNIWRNNG
jgi:hypothetical protein